MSRHVPDKTIDDICAKHLQIDKTLPPPPDALHIAAPAIVLTDSTRKYYEAVSDLNGIAVVAAYEYALLGTLTTLNIYKTPLPKVPSDTKEQAIWLCRKACDYEATFSEYRSRKVQMKGHHFAWLGSCLDATRKRLEAQFPKTSVLDFEVRLKEKDFCVADPLGGEIQTTSVYGRADIVQYEGALSTFAAESEGRIGLDDVSIWEIKFVAQLSHEHVIQACIYAYLWSNEHKREIPPRIILFNVRNGEKWEIKPRDGVASLRDVVEKTLVAKFFIEDTLTTDEFLNKCAKTKAEVEKSHEKAR